MERTARFGVDAIQGARQAQHRGCIRYLDVTAVWICSPLRSPRLHALRLVLDRGEGVAIYGVNLLMRRRAATLNVPATNAEVTDPHPGGTSHPASTSVRPQGISRLRRCQ